MGMLWCACILMTSLCITVEGYNRLLTYSKPEEYLDICLNGTNHKTNPGPESTLFEQCSPWKDHSCCTTEVAENLHVSKAWYNLDYNHCPGHELSPKCRTRFIQDLCFYECSPYVGPWLVKVNGMTIRSERFVEVPLCQTECNAWWEDCMDDYTCVENWPKELIWPGGGGFAKCPEKATCRKFSEVYKNSSYFCETVFDHSFKVVKDDTPTGCFLLWWNGNENPNKGVALQRAQMIVSAAHITVPTFLSSLASISLYLATVLITIS